MQYLQNAKKIIVGYQSVEAEQEEPCVSTFVSYICMVRSSILRGSGCLFKTDRAIPRRIMACREGRGDWPREDKSMVSLKEGRAALHLHSRQPPLAGAHQDDAEPLIGASSRYAISSGIVFSLCR